MGTFSYNKPKPLSMGNKRGYLYILTDVQTTGSILYTPFKKITGLMIETETGDNSITVSSISEGGPSSVAAITFMCDDADADGRIWVWGLL